MGIGVVNVLVIGDAGMAIPKKVDARKYLQEETRRNDSRSDFPYSNNFRLSIQYSNLTLRYLIRSEVIFP